MRFFFLLVLLAGAALGVIYPWAVKNFSGHEIGSWRVYERSSGFTKVDTLLASTDAPVRVLVDMTAVGGARVAGRQAVLTLTAATEGRTVLTDVLTFADPTVRENSPQTSQKIYRDDAGLIRDVQGGTYIFTVGQGDAEGIDIQSVDLILRSDAGELDERAQPIGLSLIAIGVIGLVIALRRGSGPRNPNSQPPQPRWGRGGENR
jgi:hypothetical protein